MSYLDELVAGARRRVDDARDRQPLAALRGRALETATGPSFADALSGPGVAVIAEVKRASPSRGPIAPDLDAAVQADAYRAGGAAAISVLTEPDHFRGSLDDLREVASRGMPALRKDFVVDPYQVWEAREVGASAVLLIVAALDDADLASLLDTAAEAGLDALVEIHDEDEAARATEAGARIVGINARDLRTFEVDREAFARIRPSLDDGVIAVAESGIRGPDDVRVAQADGADAVLVGEVLATSDEPERDVALLVSAGAAPITATEYR